MTQRYATSPGRFHPLGAIPDDGGVNFAVFCRNATAVQLLLFDRADARGPAQVIDLGPELNKTYFIWHVYVKGLRPGAERPASWRTSSRPVRASRAWQPATCGPGQRR